MIDATYLKATPYCISLRVKKGFRPPDRPHQRRMNTKLHAIAETNGCPLSFLMNAGQISDYTGAAALLDDMPKAQWVLGDRGYDADWFRDTLQTKGIEPCIPDRRSRNEPVRYDKRRYRRRSRIENMFGRLKDCAASPSTTAAQPSYSGCDQRALTLLNNHRTIFVALYCIIIIDLFPKFVSRIVRTG